VKGLEDERYVREKSGLPHTFGPFPKDRVNPWGGSVAIGHPFGATGARILSQSIKELAAMPAGSRAVVSVCADGGEGTVALLQN
jgi:acetyl-CoA C-acetyltransferase